MKVEVSRDFEKIFQKRFQNNHSVRNKFRTRTKLFSSNSANPLLKDHSLKGKKDDLRAFSITGDIRVVYYIKDNIAYFLNIGTHNQVY